MDKIILKATNGNPTDEINEKKENIVNNFQKYLQSKTKTEKNKYKKEILSIMKELKLLLKDFKKKQK